MSDTSIITKPNVYRQKKIVPIFGKRICESDFDCRSCPVKCHLAESSVEKTGYCTICGSDRVILDDMLHSQGLSRRAGNRRILLAKEIISKCPECKKYFNLL